MCVCCQFSCVQLFVMLWNIVLQAPLSMGFSRQEYWSGLSCPPPGVLSGLGIEPTSLMSPALAGWFSTTSASWEAPLRMWYSNWTYLYYYKPDLLKIHLKKNIKELFKLKNFKMSHALYMKLGKMVYYYILLLCVYAKLL